MWTILLLLAIVFKSTEMKEIFGSLSNEILPDDMYLHKLRNLRDDTYFDKRHWREVDERMLTKYAAIEHTNCSYVDDILHKNYTSGYIDIAISPLVIQKPDLSMNQHVRLIFQVPFMKGDVVNLYKVDSRSNNSMKLILLSKRILELPNLDFVDTKVFYNNEDTYFAEYLRNNETVVARAKYYRAKPAWMWCMRGSIGDRQLSKLFLPGTHDSGAYIKPRWWQNLIGLEKSYFDYVYTQEDSIFSQLMQGVRYLDLRMGKYKEENQTKFYVNHSTFKVHLLIDILDQIKEFLRYSPNEIIVLDLHLFPVGYDTTYDHDELANFLNVELNELIYRRPRYQSWNVKLNDIWKTKGRVIVAYNNYITSLKYNFFPGIRQIWGEKDKLYPLLSYMDDNIPRNCMDTDCSMQSAMTELTPRLSGIFENKYNGLRAMANLTNSIITNKFMVGSWGNSVQAAAVDFLSSTGIVAAAIRQNALRSEKEHVCH